MDHSAYLSSFIVKQIESSSVLENIESSVTERKEAQELSNYYSDELRKTYLQIFEDQEDIYDPEEDYDWWKTQFLKTGDQIKEQILILEEKEKGKESPPLLEQEFNLSFENKFYSFDLSTQKVITLGRYSGCDIEANSKLVSRLHTLIYFFPEFNKLILVDVGSQMGIRTRKRENKKEILDRSVLGARKILQFPLNESIVLELGDAKLHLMAKSCIICTNAPRTKIYSCGHYCVCEKCDLRIQLCPICRSQKSILLNKEKEEQKENKDYLLSSQQFQTLILKPT